MARDAALVDVYLRELEAAVHLTLALTRLVPDGGSDQALAPLFDKIAAADPSGQAIATLTRIANAATRFAAAAHADSSRATVVDGITIEERPAALAAPVGEHAAPIRAGSSPVIARAAAPAAARAAPVVAPTAPVAARAAPITARAAPVPVPAGTPVAHAATPATPVPASGGKRRRGSNSQSEIEPDHSRRASAPRRVAVPDTSKEIIGSGWYGAAWAITKGDEPESLREKLSQPAQNVNYQPKSYELFSTFNSAEMKSAADAMDGFTLAHFVVFHTYTLSFRGRKLEPRKAAQYLEVLLDLGCDVSLRSRGLGKTAEELDEQNHFPMLATQGTLIIAGSI